MTAATSAATCAETVASGSGTDHNACAAVTGTDLDSATACELILTDSSADASDAKACTYTAVRAQAPPHHNVISRDAH